ncbi:MAG: hypothetical protein WA705_29875 [Candidatus Ozemobacteraceae bacterium]
MPKQPVTFADYLSEAFHASYVFKGLGAVPVNKVGLAGMGILGCAFPGFWFVGAAAEVGYLWLLSTDERFQKYVRSKRNAVIETDKSMKMNAMISNLDPESVRRLNNMNANLAEVTRLMDMDSDGSTNFARESKLQNLNQLSVLFLRLLYSKRVISDSLQRTDVERIKREIKDISRQLEAPNLGEALARSLSGNLAIQERRLENIKKAEENLQVVNMELQRIENQLQLIREEVAINRSPEALTSSIDLISSTMNEAEDFMSRYSHLFSNINEGSAPSPVVGNPAATTSDSDSNSPPPPRRPTSEGQS